MIAGTSLLVISAYIVIAGWPTQSRWLYSALFLTLMTVVLTIRCVPSSTMKARIRHAEAERARMREEHLAAKVAALRRGSSRAARDRTGDATVTASLRLRRAHDPARLRWQPAR